MLPLAFFAAMVAVHADAGLTALNILACLLILVLLAYYYSAGNLDRLGITGYYLALCISAFNAMFRAAPLIPASIELRTIRRRGGVSARNVMPILRGLLLALPIAIVFTALLASADTVFATWVGAIFSLNLSFIPSVQEALWHVVLVLTVAWFVAGGIAFALSRASASETEPWEDALQSIPRTIHLGFIESTVILVVVDLIFALFGWIQFSYLFGGSINIASEGYTYADYARRGFFELLVVSLLTLMLVLGLHNFTWRETVRQSLVFKTLATIIVAPHRHLARLRALQDAALRGGLRLHRLAPLRAGIRDMAGRDVRLAAVHHVEIVAAVRYRSFRGGARLPRHDEHDKPGRNHRAAKLRPLSSNRPDRHRLSGHPIRRRCPHPSLQRRPVACL